MTSLRWIGAIVLGVSLSAQAAAAPFRPATWKRVESLNGKLRGQVLDFTHNHRRDNRIWSAALCERRDLYVYLPPGFDPTCQYPVIIYLHGVVEDEESFLTIVPWLDRAMACGDLPPCIVAAPDGTLSGSPSLTSAGSFYVNSRAGRFEDFIVCDVWNFLIETFPIRPERELHVIAGASMGGFGAYNLAIKHRDKFKIVIGLMPPLHVRYSDCRGRHFADYDPCCLGVRERVKPLQPVGRFYGVVTVRQRMFTQPLYGFCNPDAIYEIARQNPYEMLDAHDLKPGELDLFAGYGKRDEFNIDAQVESFVHAARCRGLEITCVCDPKGRHDLATGERLFPDVVRWAGPLLTQYLKCAGAAP